MGVWTFVFTDVVESTRLWQDHPTPMGDALALHDDIVRGAIDRHGGIVFTVAGDAFGAAFDDPRVAVGVAATIAQELDAAPWGEVALRVRIGVHTGTAQRRQGGFYGSDVNRAARIESLARGRQALVSSVTRDLVVDDLPSGLDLVDIGRHSLASLSRAQQLYQLVGDGLDDRLGVDGSPDASPPGNLPVAPGPYIGRREELGRLEPAVAPGRLVTLVGLGGLGKTRTATELAQRRSSHFPGGAFWLDLAPLTTDDSIPALTTNVLGITHEPGQSDTDAVIDALAGGGVLLVLDNCEHLVAEAAAFVARLRRHCPELAVLATSREPLGVAGETVWPLAPLDAASDGVELLLERLRSSDPTLAVGDWSTDALTHVCDRLDGLPLGIEMAATLLRSLRPEEVLDRLDNRFRLLRTRRRDLPDRHRSLQAALDWSYDLLGSDQQHLLDRLCVFAGSFDAATVAAVCGDGADVYDTEDLLLDLRDKSLVATAGPGRMRLLETVRDYARSRTTPEQRRLLEDRLVEHVTARVEAADAQRAGTSADGVVEAFRWFEADWDDIREAFRLAVERDDGETCRTLLVGVWCYAFETFRSETRSWARSALDLPRATPVAAAMLAVSAWTDDDSDEAGRLLELGIGSAEREDEPDPGLAYLYQARHAIDITARRPEAVESAERSMYHGRSISEGEELYGLVALAVQLAGADPGRARSEADRVHEFLSRNENPMWATLRPGLAAVEARLGRIETAHRLCSEAVDLAERGGLTWTSAMAASERARLGLRFDLGDPLGDLLTAIELARRTRAWFAASRLLVRCEGWLEANGRPEMAALIGGYLSVADPSAGRARPERQEGYEWWWTLGASLDREDLVDELSALALPHERHFHGGQSAVGSSGAGDEISGSGNPVNRSDTRVL